MKFLKHYLTGLINGLMLALIVIILVTALIFFIKVSMYLLLLIFKFHF
jgi:hypothetical protein